MRSIELFVLLLAACSPVSATSGLPSRAIRQFGESTKPSLFSSPKTGVFAVAISPDATTIATGELSEVRVWNLETGEVVASRPNRGTVHTVCFSPDGRELAWGGFGNSFALLDLATSTTTLEPDVGICVGFFASFSRDGSLILSDGPGTRGARSDEALLWDREGERLLAFRVSGQLRSALLTPNGKVAITADNQGRVVFWDTWQGKKRGEVRVDSGAVLDLSLDRTGKLLAAASAYPVPYVSLIDVSRRVELRRIDRKAAIRAVALRPDGERVAVAGNERGIEIYDTSTGRLFETLEGHRGGCSSLVYSASGDLLLSGGFYGGAILWDVRVRGRAK